MGNTVKPSTAMLPMEDISNVLKEQYQFSSKDDIAIDTAKVANTNSELIAIAATDETGALVEGRETINNALKLGGTPAAEYMTRTDGAKIENFGNNVSQIFADELAALRDEVYQLRGELSRRGFINEYGIYAGFQDFFKAGDKKYYWETLGGIISMPEANKVYPDNPNEIRINDWFVIKKTPAVDGTVSNTEYFVVRATGIDEGGVITFARVNGESLNPIDTVTYNVELLKVVGEYNSGSFSFSNLVDLAVTDKEKYTMLNDDSNTAWQPIKASKTGYAVSFRIPSMTLGALKTISIMAKRTQSPGALICYVVDEADIASIDVPSVALATSNAIDPSKLINLYDNPLADGTKIDFEFQKADGSYLNLVKDKKYTFVFVAQTADDNNFWQLQFGNPTASGSDLQVNNKTYTYAEGVPMAPIDSLGDIIFILTTLEVKENAETPSIEGLYTSEAINIKNTDSIARARLTMRINREGYFTAQNTLVVGDGGTVDVFVDTTINTSFTNMGLVPTDTIIIGNNIRKVTSASSPYSFGVDKGLSVSKDDPVYKMGYKAFLRASKKTWNPDTLVFDVTNEQLIEMPLVCVMPDRKRIAQTISDRLVFECEFRDPVTQLPLDVNTFELQIVWNTHFQKTDLISKPYLIGRINDLTLSLDRSL